MRSLTVSLSRKNFKEAFDKVVSLGVDILFCNEDEAKLWTGAETRDEAIKIIKEACPMFAITCGGEGAIVCDGVETSMVPGVQTKPVDTTGAGDIFAGSFLFALSRGKSFQQAAVLANNAASLLISNYGARLTADVVDKNLGL